MGETYLEKLSDTVICVRHWELGVETSEGHETSSWHPVMIQLKPVRLGFGIFARLLCRETRLQMWSDSYTVLGPYRA